MHILLFLACSCSTRYHYHGLSRCGLVWNYL